MALSALLRQAKAGAFRPFLSSVGRSVLDDGLTYLSPVKLWSIERCIRGLDRAGVPGDFIECGVAAGGSAIVLARALAGDRHFKGYDVFGLIPPPSERDGGDAHHRYQVISAGGSQGIGDRQYYGYNDRLFDDVLDSFVRYGLTVDDDAIALYRGRFEETLRFEPAQRIALAHIDCDWYDPVAFCLDAIYPHLSPGGVIVLDDYNDYQGCRKAADAFLATKSDLHLESTRGNAIIRRVATP